MDITVLLWTSFISLIGLNFCEPEEADKRLLSIPVPWCRNPFMRFLYGVIQLLGLLFVWGTAIYLTFTVHWWYILIYLAGGLIAKLISLILIIPLAATNMDEWFSDVMFGELKARRLVGSVIVVVGILLCVCLI